MKRDLYYEDYADQLVGEYKEAYEKMHIYVKSSLSTGLEIIPVMDEIVDLLLSAQRDGRTVKSVIGADLEKFSKGIVNGAREPGLSIVLKMRAYVFIFGVVAVFQVICLIIDANKGNKNAWMQSVDVSGFLVGVIAASFVSLLINKVTKELIFKVKKFNGSNYKKIYKIVSTVEFLFIVIIIIVSGFLVEIPRIMLIQFCFLYAVTVSIFVKRYFKKNQKYKNEENTIKIDLNQDIKNKAIDGLRNKYMKTMDKRNKRGQGSVTPKEWFEKDTKYYMMVVKVAIGLIFFAITGVIISVAVTSTIYNTIIFISVLFVVEFPVIFVLYKGISARQRLKTEILEKNTDIFDENLKWVDKSNMIA